MYAVCVCVCDMSANLTTKYLCELVTLAPQVRLFYSRNLNLWHLLMMFWFKSVWQHVQIAHHYNNHRTDCTAEHIRLASHSQCFISMGDLFIVWLLACLPSGRLSLAHTFFTEVVLWDLLKINMYERCLFSIKISNGCVQCLLKHENICTPESFSCFRSLVRKKQERRRETQVSLACYNHAVWLFAPAW